MNILRRSWLLPIFNYTEAPWLSPRLMQAAAALNWIDVPLSGNTAYKFDEEIANLQPQLAEGWRVRASEKTGKPLYERPSVQCCIGRIISFC